MGTGFAAPPSGPRYVLRNATLPAALVAGVTLPPRRDVGCVAADVLVEDGSVAALATPGALPQDVPALDLDGGMVWPGFVDAHTHLDKGHIWPRRANPDGTFPGALAAVMAGPGAE